MHARWPFQLRFEWDHVVLPGARRKGSTTWVVAIATIADDGTVSGVVADELIVWGWPSGADSAPSLNYDGPVAGAVVNGWSEDGPFPVLMQSRVPAFPARILSIGRIARNGAVSDIIAGDLLVWDWQ